MKIAVFVVLAHHGRYLDVLVGDYLGDRRRTLAEADLLHIDALVVGSSRIHHLQGDDLIGGDVLEAVRTVLCAVSRRVVAAICAQDKKCSHLLQQTLTHEIQSTYPSWCVVKTYTIKTTTVITTNN